MSTEISDPSSRKTWRQNRERLLRDKIDLTRFLVWFTETYPDSMDRINDYQDV